MKKEYKVTGELIWKSEEEMRKELNERIANWKQGYSRDGYIQKATGKFVYRGVAYIINVLRYYNHTNRFVPMGDNISDSFANVEYPEETKPIIELVSGIEDVYDFLYHDTNHSHNENQTVEQKIEECHKLAKQDIDSLLDGAISFKLEKSINALKILQDKINNFASSTLSAPIKKENELK